MNHPLRENLENHVGDGGEWIRCSRCQHTHCRGDQDWRQQPDEGDVVFEAGSRQRALGAVAKEEAVLAVYQADGADHDDDERRRGESG